MSETMSSKLEEKSLQPDQLMSRTMQSPSEMTSTIDCASDRYVC